MKLATIKLLAAAVWAKFWAMIVSGSKVAWSEERKVFCFMVGLTIAFIALAIFRSEWAYLIAAATILFLTTGLCAIFAYQDKSQP